jgi:hypothetical protein
MQEARAAGVDKSWSQDIAAQIKHAERFSFNGALDGHWIEERRRLRADDEPTISDRSLRRCQRKKKRAHAQVRWVTTHGRAGDTGLERSNAAKQQAETVEGDKGVLCSGMVTVLGSERRGALPKDRSQDKKVATTGERPWPWPKWWTTAGSTDRWPPRHSSLAPSSHDFFVAAHAEPHTRTTTTRNLVAFPFTNLSFSGGKKHAICCAAQ